MTCGVAGAIPTRRQVLLNALLMRLYGSPRKSVSQNALKPVTPGIGFDDTLDAAD